MNEYLPVGEEVVLMEIEDIFLEFQSNLDQPEEKNYFSMKFLQVKCNEEFDEIFTQKKKTKTV